MAETIHNPDRYIGDLRQILAQGRKRLGILLGAGSPFSIRVDKTSGKISADGDPLIPCIAGLTQRVLSMLSPERSEVVQKIADSIAPSPNIEMILSRIRSLSALIGSNEIHCCDGPKFQELGRVICESIGEIVGPELPREPNPYSEFASWVGGTDRRHPIEIFTPNYDLLMEEAFERAKIPYFDGFSGSFEPFFDPSTVTNNDLPPRWVRLWKLHGSLGWGHNGSGELVRGKGRKATELIYPDHLKYDQIQKMPYTAFFDRFRKFLMTPDTLLLTCGFSFADAHISAVIDESLAANAAGSVFAFQFKELREEGPAQALAHNRPNMSVYAKDGAVINCIHAPWRPGDLPNPDWVPIRASYWGTREPGAQEGFLLGSFKEFARFFALARAEQISVPEPKMAEVIQ